VREVHAMEEGMCKAEHCYTHPFNTAPTTTKLILPRIKKERADQSGAFKEPPPSALSHKPSR